MLVCLFTSDTDKMSETRMLLKPQVANGLKRPSLIQAEKIYPIPRAKFSAGIGALTEEQMTRLDSLLAFVLGLGD